MPSILLPAIGETFECVYPFVRDTFERVDACEESVDFVTTDTWKPGTRNELVGNESDTESCADGMGRMVLTVVSTHKPGRYPMRVFYTRSWVTPDGKAFGKTKCRMSTVGAFRSLAGGYRHPFVLLECQCDGCDRFSDHRVGDQRAVRAEAV